MKKTLITIIFVGSLIFSVDLLNAQCKDFAADVGLEIMNTDEYVHDGRFNAIRLREGDDIRLFKSFYSGEEYRVVVVGEGLFEKLEFEILDFRGQDVLHSSKDSVSYFWDYTSDVSQRLIVAVHVPVMNKKDPKKGCVAILFGLKREIEEDE